MHYRTEMKSSILGSKAVRSGIKHARKALVGVANMISRKKYYTVK